jgi:hypothetical protein
MRRFLLGLLVAAVPCLASGADRVEVVSFEAGASAATLAGSVEGYDTISYVLSAGAGQVMSVAFSPDNSSCYFSLFPPGGGDAIFDGSMDGHESSNELPATGDYRAQVYLLGNAARRGETCAFTMTFRIDG